MSGYTSFKVNEVKERKTGKEKHPFPHQLEAFGALSSTLETPIKGYRGTMLVLPTGAGKTFTAVNWIYRNIISKGIKVLWLAQSSYLLDQAEETLKNEIYSITGRDTINLRVVSSSDHHSNAGSILPSDDIIVCTTQTAIRAYSTEAADARGNIRHTPFRIFIDNLSDSELFIVVDEAHHTPAYGCRTLLNTIRENLKNLYVLGLTATPFHTDKRISGWLWHIFDKEICYEADKNLLQTNGILAVPKYIEKKTGIEFEVDDKLYKRLTTRHKDLPDYIIEKLANDSARNNYIVSDYVNNKELYGKTLIFADRWFQCEYIVEKLESQGIRANAVYSKIENNDTLFVDNRGRRSNKDNEKIMQEFREGKYDVIVNVKMLTEGVDVPDVKTVMITRQTTSPILFTQMVGRALRGKKAGGGEGKEYANIVLFMDSWKKLLPFVKVAGGKGTEKILAQGRNPFDTISIQLVKNASADIPFAYFENAPYLTFIPIGWYAAEYTASIEDNGSEEFITCIESVLVYDFNSHKYQKLIDYLVHENLEEWANERLAEDDEDLISFVKSLTTRFFNEEDNLDGNLSVNIIKIISHIAQNNSEPEFLNFNERNIYDLDKIAAEHIDAPPRESHTYLKNLFNNEGMHWKVLYSGNFSYFKKAFDQAVNRILNGDEVIEPIPESDDEDLSNALTEEIREQVYQRDNYQCCCCGKERRRGVSLEIDHILPIAMGGKNVPSNLQTLCRQCNRIKGVNEIDYRSIVSPLTSPKALQLFPVADSDEIQNAVARIVNHIYHCSAFCKLEYSKRKNGRYYHTWIIKLYSGNNPQWLEQYSSKLVEHIGQQLGWDSLERIIIKD